MIRFTIFLFVLILYNIAPLFSQSEQFSIVFYNVENLFDTINNQGKNDIEFTPESDKKWNSTKYFNKLDEIAKVISHITPGKLPDLIGLAEIENRKVLEDLIKRPPLQKGGYGIAHTDSPDPRGIDVALLYKKETFKNVSNKVIPVTFPFDSNSATRDILLVSGTTPDGNVFHVFINHWTSRQGGIRATEPRRMHSAVALRRNIDLLLTKDSDSRIIVMGDFNDEPTNQSIMNIMQATNKRKNATAGDLYNLYYDFHNMDSGGSYFFENKWIMPDQIIVSRNLLNRKGSYNLTYDSGKVFSAEWMLTKNKDGVQVPKRTYGGDYYIGGVSDHLPVFAIFSR